MPAAEAILDESLRRKRDACMEILQELKSVVVAFSGGVDSSLLLALAVEAMGHRNVLAAMAVSTIFPQRELRAGREFARQIGVELLEVETPQLVDASFTSNPSDRCYYCKTRILSRLKALAEQRGFKAVVSGSNASDTGDYRPGLLAEEQMGIRRPLMEAGLTKDDVRAISRAMDLPGWDRPSLACLATRIPYGEPITSEKLTRIEQAEEFLEKLGFPQCRVRDHQTVARVEVPAEQLPAALERRDRIVERLRTLGYTFVALDLAGYRTGAMNEAVNHESQVAGRDTTCPPLP